MSEMLLTCRRCGESVVLEESGEAVAMEWDWGMLEICTAHPGRDARPVGIEDNLSNAEAAAKLNEEPVYTNACSALISLCPTCTQMLMAWVDGDALPKQGD